ncbi:MAG: cytochrome P450, partial [Minicystis sp.]
IKQILTGDPMIFNAAEGNSVLGAVLGQSSLMLLDGPPHARQRKLMMPAFHGDRLQRYAAGIRASTATAISAWKKADRLTLQEAMQALTLDVILRVVLGLDDETEKAPVREAILRVLHRVQSPTGAIWMLPAFQKDLGPFTPWAAIKRTITEMDQAIFAHIARRRASAGERDDVLSMLLAAVDEEGIAMSDVEIRDELVTLLLAGHETSALAIAWSFEELLRAPDEQARLHAEVTQLGEGSAHLAERVPRLDAVIKEALRLHPITGGVARRLKQPVTIEGWDLPAGVVLVPCFHLLHRRPDLYPDPDRFLPERFIGKKIDPYEWIPFGGGAHRCIGMAFAMLEMRVVMAEILSRVELRLEAKGPAETTLRSLLNAPKGGTKVIVERVLQA